MKKIPKPEDLEHISAEEFCSNMDAILDRVSKEDTAIAIDYKSTSYVICPVEWFYEPKKGDNNE